MVRPWAMAAVAAAQDGGAAGWQRGLLASIDEAGGALGGVVEVDIKAARDTALEYQGEVYRWKVAKAGRCMLQPVLEAPGFSDEINVL